LCDEKKRRFSQNTLERYNKGKKVHIKQIEFHKCKKKNRWVFGGNRTGKTECGAVEAVWLARGIHPYRENKKDVEGWVVSLSTQVQRDVAQKKVLHYLNKDWIFDVVMSSGKKDSMEYGIIDKILIKNVFGGISTIGFKSCDQGREKFQGTSLDFVWFDEEPPEDIYKECKMRIIDKEGELFGTMTPLKGLTWVYNEIYLNERNDENVWYENISWQDNPFLNQKEIEKLKSQMSEKELESRCDGKFISQGGLVYPNFDENINVIEPFDVDKSWFDMISIDPGYTNPLSCHFYACDGDGNIFVIAEIYGNEIPIEEHSKRIHEVADSLGWKKDSKGYLTALIDSASLQKTLSSQDSVAQKFYDNKIYCNTKVNKSLVGLQTVRKYICDANGNRKLFIFKNCVNMIREIKSYSWGNDESPIKKDDHAMDELRYYLMYKQTEFKPVGSSSQTEKYKLKLMNELKRRSNLRYG
ncbi:MAG: phage terminase large subunit, partial [Clostridiales bacterium]|nr:phage terminase large subunit [Candidatus Apopatousia equi]